MRKLLMLSSCLVVAATAAARPAHAAPAWCKAAIEAKLRPSYTASDIAKEDDPGRVLSMLVPAVCSPEDDQKRDAKQIEAQRQTWTKRFGMTEADWADAADWAVRAEDRYASGPEFDYKLAWSKYTPVDQYEYIDESTIGMNNVTNDEAYATDAMGAKLTESGRVAWMAFCVAKEDAPVLWAMCQPDIAVFDLKKMNGELRADTSHPGWMRMKVRIAAAALGPKLIEHAKRVKALRSKDPGYEKMFAISETTRREWSKVDPKLLDLMAAMDDARVSQSRKAAEGCTDKTWEAYKTVVATIPAKVFGEIRAEPGNSFLEQAIARIVATPNGYLAALAMYQCGKFAEKEEYFTRMLGNGMQRWPGFRGPRNAAHTAILTGGIELDDRSARIEYPDLTRYWIGGNASSGGGGVGAVSKITTKGNTASITFEKVKSTQHECTKGHQTNRITQIRSDGTLVYGYVCEKSRTYTIMTEPFPAQTVNARYVGALKKGMVAHVVEDVVTVVYPKDKAVPIMVTGVSVK